MTLRFKFAVLACALTACLGLTAWAPNAAAMGWGAQQVERAYKLDAVETVTGTITTIDRATTWRPGQPGIRLAVRTDKETLTVLVGPAWYIDKQAIAFKVGDRLKVTGSRFSLEGAPAMLAGSLTSGGETLTLRDATGRPGWGSKRR